MNTEQNDEFIRRTIEINNTLEAMITYLNRNKRLLDKLSTYDVPPSHLEEWGEFLIDFGRVLESWGVQNRERESFFLDVFRDDK